MRKLRNAPILAVCILAGCLTGHRRPPAELEIRAAQFRAKAGAYRVPEGEQLAQLLPICPIHSEHWGMERWNNWEKPSYKLRTNDLFREIGKPDRLFMVASLGELNLADGHTMVPPYRWGPTSFAIYDLGQNAEKREWELMMILYNDYVVASGIMSREKLERSVHTYHGNSMVFTNLPP